MDPSRATVLRDAGTTSYLAADELDALGLEHAPVVRDLAKPGDPVPKKGGDPVPQRPGDPVATQGTPRDPGKPAPRPGPQKPGDPVPR
jgi:hypothetical protein